MATYRVVGKKFVMGTTVDQVSLNAEGQEVVTRYAGPAVVYEVGAEVDDLPADILAAFPDRFVRVDAPDGPSDHELEASLGQTPQPKRHRAAQNLRGPSYPDMTPG